MLTVYVDAYTLHNKFVQSKHSSSRPQLCELENKSEDVLKMEMFVRKVVFLTAVHWIQTSCGVAGEWWQGTGYVSLECTPNSDFWNGSVFPPSPTQLEMNCDRGGNNKMIYVDSAEYGESTEDTCYYEDGDWCLESVLTTEPVTDCMTEEVCHIDVQDKYLSRCDDGADYLDVHYTCLPELDRYDICGNWEDSNPGPASGEEEIGYIFSPHYPEQYPNNVDCQCEFSSDQGVQIRVEFLDFSLEADDSCEHDRLTWETRSGRREECDQHPRKRNMFKSQLGTAKLGFHSDGTTAQRGFWLRFRGVKTNGDFAPVAVNCTGRVDEDTEVEDGSGSSDETDNDSETGSDEDNTVMIIAVAAAVTALIVIGVIVAAVILCKRRGSSRPTSASKADNFRSPQNTNKLPVPVSQSSKAHSKQTPLHNGSGPHRNPAYVDDDTDRDYAELRKGSTTDENVYETIDEVVLTDSKPQYDDVQRNNQQNHQQDYGRNRGPVSVGGGTPYPHEYTEIIA